MPNPQILKASITSSLEDLPPASLEALAEFTSFLRAKNRRKPERRTVALRGLWKGQPEITEEDIAEARQEMWGNFGAHKL